MIYEKQPGVPKFECFEYEKRKKEQMRLIEMLNAKNENKIKFLDSDYNPSEFANAICGFENEKEGSERCKHCYFFRLGKTAHVAEKNGFNFFGTTSFTLT